MSATDSLRGWLREQIAAVLGRKSAPPPFIVWCDPARVWRDLLLAAAEGGAFELWADEVHELLLRERFHTTPRAPRVVWLPVAWADIGYFKVFELQAAAVKQWTPAEALVEYGVEISPQQLAELAPLLPAHMKEWIDRPRDAWKELTVGTAEGTLVDDDRILEVLAGAEAGFDKLVAEDRFAVFARRVKDDFGLPAPKAENAEAWRREALATMLCTDAAIQCPANPPGEPARIIPAGAARDRAVKLLGRWTKQVDLAELFEKLAPQADGMTSLAHWAGNIGSLPRPLHSPAAEAQLFEAEVTKLAAVETVGELARHLESQQQAYREHAKAFWGSRAKVPIPWGSLSELAEVAGLISEHNGTEQGWKSTEDAVRWFTAAGWQVDHAGEKLFLENAQAARELDGLVKVRSTLRKAYLRHLDRVNAVFSELLAASGTGGVGLPFAGESIRELVSGASTKAPVAVLVLDACRYDLGCRLADAMNQGEPAPRARVSACRSTVPSITPLGMSACLPLAEDALRVEAIETSPFWSITTDGFGGNLAIADQRRQWLRSNLKLKDKAILRVEDVLSPSESAPISAKALGRLVFVFGDEFDTEGHDGRLKLTGTQEHLERYAHAMRRLRDAGYSTVVVVTDHGFFHWDPAPDEREFPKPKGDICWESRRAIVGHELEGGPSVKLSVTGGQMDCCIPRGVASFKTYGGLGFFHGGATLQELIIPVVVAEWPKKARKVQVVLKPLAQITSVAQRVEVGPAGQRALIGGPDENLLSRQVVVKVVDGSGKLLFRSQPVSVEPGGDVQAVQLAKVSTAEAPAGAKVTLQAVDADDEELLDHREVTLAIGVSEWD